MTNVLEILQCIF